MPIVPSSAYFSARTITNLVRSLLNDAGSPGLPIAISSIQRSVIAGISTVTVTTIGQHGVIVGDQATIALVTDTSFNGTFYVAANLSPTQYTYVQTGAVTTSSGGFSTAVGLGNVFTDPVLLPYLNSAYRVVQRAVSIAGQATFKVDNAFVVVPKVAAADPSLQVNITDATAAPNQLPVDLLEPLFLWERPVTLIGGVVQLTSTAFTEMTNVTDSGGLPSINQAANLMMWEWRTDGIWFLGALQDVQVRIRYRKSLPILSAGDSQILIRNADEACAYITAALAAQARGSTQAEKYDSAGTDAIEKLIAGATRARQRVGTRRKPYDSRRARPGARWVF